MLSIYLSINLSVYLSIYLPVCLSAWLAVCLAVCLPGCLSVCLPGCLAVYIYDNTLGDPDNSYHAHIKTHPGANRAEHRAGPPPIRVDTETEGILELIDGE